MFARELIVKKVSQLFLIVDSGEIVESEALLTSGYFQLDGVPLCWFNLQCHVIYHIMSYVISFQVICHVMSCLCHVKCYVMSYVISCHISYDI